MAKDTEWVEKLMSLVDKVIGMETIYGRAK